MSTLKTSRLIALTAGSLAALGAGPLALAAAGRPAAAASPQMPLTFVENRGQLAPEIRYMGSGPEFSDLFLDDRVTFLKADARFTLSFVAAAQKHGLDAAGPVGAVANFFSGPDPSRWRQNLPLFGYVTYHDLWPGIDIRYRAQGSNTVSEYVVREEVGIRQVRLRFDGDVRPRNDGGITVSKRLAANQIVELSFDPPAVLLEKPAGMSRAAAVYHVLADGTVSLNVSGNLIQPSSGPNIVFGGYFGDGTQSAITGVAINSYNNIIVAGWTNGSGFPASGGAKTTYSGGVDAFVAGFSPAGGQLLFCTYLGGSGEDQALGLAVDSSNNTYVTGWTSSSNFPVVNPVQSKLSGTRDAFVTKLNPAGSAILYSTYLGGSGADEGYSIALDSAGEVIIAGDTTSSNLPATSGSVRPAYSGNQDAFVAKMSSTGTSIVFATYLGGSGQDHGAAVALDSAGSIYVGGSTYSTNFPVQNAAQAHSGGGQDGFVTKLSSNGKSLVFSTYYGGSGGGPGQPEEVNAIALTATNVVVAGTTSSANFPITTVSSQTVFGGGLTDGFVGRFNMTSGVMTRSTYFGGSGDDGINAVALDFYGTTYVAGYTDSVDFPLQNPIQGSAVGGLNAFVAKLGTTYVAFASCIGSSGSGTANAIAVDSMTNVVVAGQTGSSNFPVSGSLEPWPGGALSTFLVKVSPPFTPTLFSAGTFIFDVWHDTGYNGPNITLNTSVFGQSGDIPVSGDWDGSGVKRIGVFRNGNWLLDINGDGVFDSGDKTVAFGQAGDLPVVGDWNGTGTLKLGLFRQGAFILDLSGHLSGIPTGLNDATFAFGLPGDLPVANDWNHSGTTKVGVFRNGQWLVDFNGDQVFNGLDQTYTFGQAGDIPVIGDWENTGNYRIGVYRNGLWILDYVGFNEYFGAQYEFIFAFGSSSYVPLIL